MLLSEGARYEASLEAVRSGTATATQIDESEAVLFGISSYLSEVSSRLQRIKTLRAILQSLADDGILTSDKTDAALAAIQGASPSNPAIEISGVGVIARATA